MAKILDRIMCNIAPVKDACLILATMYGYDTTLLRTALVCGDAKTLSKLHDEAYSTEDSSFASDYVGIFSSADDVDDEGNIMFPAAYSAEILKQVK